MVGKMPAMQETSVQALGLEDPLEKEMATHSVFLPGESLGHRSLVGYSPRGCKELDMTKRLSLTHSAMGKHLAVIGKPCVCAC